VDEHISSKRPPRLAAAGQAAFQNMSGDPEQEYFADGIVEEIITALSRNTHGRFDRRCMMSGDHINPGPNEFGGQLDPPAEQTVGISPVDGQLKGLRGKSRSMAQVGSGEPEARSRGRHDFFRLLFVRGMFGCFFKFSRLLR
jgi:hypothetical protein